ncbi:hypothetical protein [Micromonospora wenchangensis]|uniref:hypothetical protein n=1 Tax=Micromonospora wenchangensis TaxID=1185415 RepID=UPI00380AABA0
MRPPLPPRPPQPAGPCPLARQFWVTAGACEVVTVGTTRIGVVVRAATDSRFHLR